MKIKRYNSIWDYLISTLPSEEGDIDNNISALYVYDDKHYDISDIDASSETIIKQKSISKSVSKFIVKYNDKQLVKYTTCKPGYKIKIISDRVKECKLTTTDIKKRSKINKRGYDEI